MKACTPIAAARPTRPRPKLRPIALVAVLVAALSLTTLYGCEQSEAPSVDGTDEVGKLLSGIQQDGLALGSTKAPLTIYIYADLKCPICRKLSTNILPSLIDRYVRSGEMRLEYRFVGILDGFTLERESTRAAEMASALSLQDRAWHFAELFYRNQGEETESYVTDDFLRGLVTATPDAAADRAFDDRNNPEVRSIMYTAALGYNALGRPGTPTLAIHRPNGREERVVKPSITDPAAWIPVIDRLVEEARAERRRSAR